MGRSDPHIFNFYNQNIKPSGSTALLGFTNNKWFDGDLYDLQLGNWNINSEWELSKKYDTIICLNDGGKLYVDWGLGDHWRFKDYKIGWVKNKKQEYSYHEDNYLWSTVWDDSFINNPEYNKFEQRVSKFNYTDVKKAIHKEVPSLCQIKSIKKYFNLSYNMLALWNDMPQLYILISGEKHK